jgi:WD40 repeat protein
MSSGRVGGDTHSEVADMAVTVDKFQRQIMSPSAATLNYKPHLILSGHKKSISSVKFSPDGNLLASAGVSLSVSPSTYLQTV